MSSTNSRYSRTTHVVPASIPPDGEKDTIRHGLSGRLYLVAHEYLVANSDARPSINLILTHGTSFNRQFWTLVIDYLLRMTDQNGISINRIITFDAVNHGDSAVLNGHKLPSQACWPDSSRDIIQVVKHFRLQDQPLVGIGHSFGGGTMCHAAMMDPSLFVMTILVEPILFQMKEQTDAVANMTLKRRSQWSSKEDVNASFSKSAAFKDWDPRQLQVYVEHGTLPLDLNDPSSPWILKTPKEQEAATYRARPFPGILDLIKTSRQNLHFIWGAESKVISSDKQQLVSQMLHHPCTSQAVLEAGHLIPMSHPEGLAIRLAQLLSHASLRQQSIHEKL